MYLKSYQNDSLNTLSKFLRDAKIYGVKTAYQTHAVQNEANLYSGNAYKPLEGVEDAPAVCIRIPTGGGKTILASHSVKLASEYTEKDFPVILWLVPSDTIRKQTVDALKKPSHPYRSVIDDQFGGTSNVQIFDIDDYTRIRPIDLTDNVAIIVGTVQALRITDTNQRKVYAHNENLEPHFAHIQPAENMEHNDDGQLKFSFANLMVHHRPVMILDEGHRFKSKLSGTLLERLNPSLVLEFTATPKGKDNVLVSVPATTLRDEEMIKLPIKLSQHMDWQGTVNSAIAQREELAKTCVATGEKIRPILLFQAENKDKTVNTEVLKNYLVDVENIAPEKIAIATGEQRELDDIDVMADDCPIEYIITVQALKEGWDCPYAYVFCSVANIQNSTDIEQLLGRVLRMPFAKRRKAEELNSAYAFVPETTQFANAASKLVDKLIDMGFEEDEAIEVVTPTQSDFDLDGGGFDPDILAVSVPVASDFALEMLDAEAAELVELTETPAGVKELKVKGSLTREQQAVIAKQIVGSTKEKSNYKRILETTARYYAKQESPAMCNVPFAEIPQLSIDYGEGYLTASPDIFLEAIEWNPLNYNHLVDFSVDTNSSMTYTIDIGVGQAIEIQQAESKQIEIFALDGWDKKALTMWLEQRLRAHAQNMLHQSMIVEYIGRNLDNLITNGIDIAVLGRCRHQLLEVLKRNLSETQERSRHEAMEQFLFASDAQVISDNTFEFGKYDYNPPQQYHGRFAFKKHYYAAVANMNNEEIEVARLLDNMEQVEFWVRNLEQGKAFKLPLAKNNFYPDFVAKLKDGRTLVVEHKGAHLVSADEAKAKNRIGEFWAEKTGNLFVMTVQDNKSKPLAMQVLEALV